MTMAGQTRTLPVRNCSATPPSTGVEHQTWEAEALCRNSHPDALFVGQAQQQRAARICYGCPVLRQCAAHALNNKVEYGVWGVMTERGRKALLKQHPDVASWADLLCSR